MDSKLRSCRNLIYNGKYAELTHAGLSFFIRPVGDLITIGRAAYHQYKHGDTESTKQDLSRIMTAYLCSFLASTATAGLFIAPGVLGKKVMEGDFDGELMGSDGMKEFISTAVGEEYKAYLLLGAAVLLGSLASYLAGEGAKYSYNQYKKSEEDGSTVTGTNRDTSTKGHSTSMTDNEQNNEQDEPPFPAGVSFCLRDNN